MQQDVPVKKIVIFASGNGTNAENIIRYFQDHPGVEVTYVFSNKKNAGVLKKAHNLEVKALFFDREAFYKSNEVLHLLIDVQPQLIVLAGFLWKFPENIIKHFEGKIINIHPALLPKYGGKGMYGDYVHRAVVENQEEETGITIHYVNENYDEGAIIFQAKTNIKPGTTPEEVAHSVHELEYKHFPEVIEKLLSP
ncbi:phosphoribosylglycinamide formyltransferase [Aquimarina sp. ERC-38]|uniref:phosphoribosylglycinamide formyltransferase n=1 Tax=Aquimarina sp. ERC-38 TaxID=2949996 RepID=UPI002246C687|nr:phosphoribosylglycinamide formyltransferase [Aquimarina sp. ERC-38]UZO81784.1 phosphoribosylglycinamide formyltransferase [Aquimarina sp. ERC-38]